MEGIGAALPAMMAEQRCRAISSMEGDKSRAWMEDKLVLDEGGMSLAVLRPVPQPNSVILASVGGRRARKWARKGGRHRSSVVWRMLPSVS